MPCRRPRAYGGFVDAKPRTLLAPIVALMLVVLSGGGAAGAALPDDVQAGRALAQQLAAGSLACSDLGSDDFEYLGEFVMKQMVGSVQLHDQMNARMRSMMGDAGEERMHVAMGQRFAGCAAWSGEGWMGPGMMGDRWDSGDVWDGMMGSPMWDWMGNGNWQQMDRADWQRLSDQWFVPAASLSRSGWSSAAIALVATGGVLAVALIGVIFAVTLRRRRGSPVV